MRNLLGMRLGGRRIGSFMRSGGQLVRSVRVHGDSTGREGGCDKRDGRELHSGIQRPAPNVQSVQRLGCLVGTIRFIYARDEIRNSPRLVPETCDAMWI